MGGNSIIICGKSLCIKLVVLKIDHFGQMRETAGYTCEYVCVNR